MSTLAEHWSEWLEPGDYDGVVIKSHRMFEFNSGSAGVEIEVQDEATGGKAKISFCLHDKAIWKLSQFARTLGFGKHDVSDFQVFDSQSYTKWYGRRVGITVGLDAKGYCEVTATWPVGRPPANRPEPAPKLATTTEGEKPALRM